MSNISPENLNLRQLLEKNELIRPYSGDRPNSGKDVFGRVLRINVTGGEYFAKEFGSNGRLSAQYYSPGSKFYPSSENVLVKEIRQTRRLQAAFYRFENDVFQVCLLTHRGMTTPISVDGNSNFYGLTPDYMFVGYQVSSTLYAS